MGKYKLRKPDLTLTVCYGEKVIERTEAEARSLMETLQQIFGAKKEVPEIEKVLKKLEEIKRKTKEPAPVIPDWPWPKDGPDKSPWEDPGKPYKPWKSPYDITCRDEDYMRQSKEVPTWHVSCLPN